MLENRPQLAAVLADDPARLGQVFARHAYGMLRWVDLFSARVSVTADPAAKELLARLVAANARHMNLFRARASAHGVDPDAYDVPREGEAIYERLDELTDFDDVVAYALASLDHFAQLLAVYAEAATGQDAAVIAEVRADNDTARELLGPLAPVALGAGAGAGAEAHELYRRRELVETELYAA